jgi:Retrotransposon gag protein
MRFNRTSIITNEDKVIFCATYLRGSAYDWFEPTLTNFMENTPADWKDATTATFNSYVTFKANLKKVYNGVNEERIVERQLQALRQTGSATEYASKFQQISSRVEWDDAALNATFYTGLKDHVKDKIARMKRLEELAEMIDTAIRIDNRVYERQMERTRGRAPFQPRYKANTSRFKKPSQGLYPREMDLDATQHRKKDSHPRRKRGLTKAQ